MKLNVQRSKQLQCQNDIQQFNVFFIVFGKRNSKFNSLHYTVTWSLDLKRCDCEPVTFYACMFLNAVLQLCAFNALYHLYCYMVQSLDAVV